MANVLFTRTSDPNSKPITDGQLIFNTSGNGKMYLDNGTERLEMGGALTVDATLSKTSTNPVQNKAVAGVMLDTLSDIINVTSKGFLPDALAVKELNSSLGGLRFGVDSSGNYGYIKAGADSVTPFKKGATLIKSNIDANGSTIDIKSLVSSYGSLSADNFMIVPLSMKIYSSISWGGVNSGDGSSTSSSISLLPTYNASTGILTLPNMLRAHSAWAPGGGATAKVSEFKINVYYIG